MAITVLRILFLRCILYNLTGVKHMMEFEVDEFNHSEEYSNGCTIYGPYDQRRLKGLKMKIDLPTQFQIYFHQFFTY